MTPELWLHVGLYLVVGSIVLGVAALPRFRDRETPRLARSLGLPLSPTLETHVRSRVIARRRGGVVGALLGLAVSTAMVASEATPPPGSLTPLVLVGGVFAGMAVGVATVAALHSIRIVDDRPRIARAEAVTVNDYVAWVERWAARLPVALATVFLAFSLLLATLGTATFEQSPLLLLGGLVTLAAIAAWGFFELASRHLVRRGQPSASLEELAWDDALRSVTIRDLVSAPLVLGIYGAMLVIVDLSAAVAAADPGEWVRTATLIAVNVIANALVYVAVLTILFIIASKPQRHFLRRLWPELAAEVQP